jgi:hypothetical protein
MIAIKGMEMPKNCIECNHKDLQEAINCQLIYNGCANCGKHPGCPLVEIITCKECKYARQSEDNDRHCYFSAKYHDVDYYSANGERKE